MPFSWEAARQPLVSGGMGIVQSLLQESGRQKEEGRQIAAEQRRHQTFLKELNIKLKGQKDLYAWKRELDADYDMFGNNLDMKRLYDEAALPTAGAETKALVAGLEAMKFKQQSMIPLSEEDYAFKERLIGLGYEGISLYIDDREMKNARIIEQLKSREKQYELLAGARQAEAEAKREITYREERTKYRTKQKEEFEDIDKKITGYKEKLKREVGKAKKEITKEDLEETVISEEETIGGQKLSNVTLVEFYRNEIRRLEEKKISILKRREREIGGTATARTPERETKPIIPPEIQLVMDELGISFEEAMRFEEERKKKYGIK